MPGGSTVAKLVAILGFHYNRTDHRAVFDSAARRTQQAACAAEDRGRNGSAAVSGSVEFTGQGSEETVREQPPHTKPTSPGDTRGHRRIQSYLPSGRELMQLVPFINLLDRRGQRRDNSIRLRSSEALFGFFEIAGKSPNAGDDLILRQMHADPLA